MDGWMEKKRKREEKRQQARYRMWGNSTASRTQKNNPWFAGWLLISFRLTSSNPRGMGLPPDLECRYCHAAFAPHSWLLLLYDSLQRAEINAHQGSGHGYLTSGDLSLRDTLVHDHGYLLGRCQSVVIPPIKNRTLFFLLLLCACDTGALVLPMLLFACGALSRGMDTVHKDRRGRGWAW